MNERNKFLFLFCLMISVAIIVVGTTLWFLYSAAHTHTNETLSVAAKSQAELLDAMVRYNRRLVSDTPKLAESIATKQFLDAHAQYRGFGETGEFTLATLVDDHIAFIFVTDPHFSRSNERLMIPLDSHLAEPMRQALLGNSGTIAALDYKGSMVLAAYEPVKELNAGIVVKLNIEEVRRPFYRAMLVSFLIAFVLIIPFTLLFIQFSENLLRSSRKKSDALAEANQNLQREIAERKGAEERLRLSQIRLTHAEKVALLGHWEWNVPEGTWYYSSSIAVIFELEEDWRDTRRLSLSQYIHPDDRELADSALRNALKTGEKQDLRYRVQLYGRTKYIHEQIEVTLNSHGETTHLFGTIHDITQTVQIENSLRSSELRYRELVENAHEGIWVFNHKEQTTFANQRMAEILGVSVSELLYQSIWKFIAPSYTTKMRDIIMDLRSGERRRYEIEFVSAEGKLIYIELNTTPFAKSISHDGFLAFITDITRRKIAEQERNVLENQLRQSQKMEAIGTLAGGIAHDFNNILFALLGFAQMLREDIPQDRIDLKESVDEIITAGRRAKELVKQILTFSRKVDQELKPLSIQPLLRESIKFLRATLPTTIEIQESIYQDVSNILADHTQVHQVIMNLCTNAEFAMRSTGGVLKISLKQITIPSGGGPSIHMKEGDYALLQVSDTGEGMTPEIIDHIFEPFFTTKPPGRGTGMGLAVVHGIVHNYGGEILVESEIGKGSTFSIFIPTVAENANQDESSPFEELIGSEHILIVDDEAMIVKFEQRILESWGYRVTAVSDSQEALTLFTENPNRFDLVLTDQSMPKLSGDQLARRMLAIRPELPIILITGFSYTMDELQAKAIGICDFLLKPLEPDKLGRAIRASLDTRPIAQNIASP